ncbi:hypothetical protein [Arachidicoccus terrestris]|uniref:hypothetical protein n=1 Tax=Arachidicoccus terrestris TaxID=2875539 RepID=UPI001CC5EABB|nr:hypothetical protein [Arachidicoccus terrestris]
MEKRIKNTAGNKLNSVTKPVFLSMSFLLLLLILGTSQLMAQCALCTKTAQQLGDGPAAGLNKGILYLMCIPLSILSVIGYKWYKKEKLTREMEDSQ